MPAIKNFINFVYQINVKLSKYEPKLNYEQIPLLLLKNTHGSIKGKNGCHRYGRHVIEL